MLYILTSFLFLIGLFGIITQRNLIKIIISISIVENAVNMFLVIAGYRNNGIAPILTSEADKAVITAQSVDPFPQAMVITSIVIGLSVLALMVAISLRLYHTYGTYNIDEIIKKQKERS